MQYITSGYQNVNVIIFQHFGRKLCHHNLNSLTLENLKFEPPSQQCPSDAKSIFLSFFQIDIHCVKSDQIRSFFQSIFSCIRTEHRKIRTRKNSLFGHLVSFSLFPTIICNLKAYVKLPAYARTSCWNTYSVVMSVPYDLTNFMQIGRYKINADAGCQFCHFLSSRLVK